MPKGGGGGGRKRVGGGGGDRRLVNRDEAVAAEPGLAGVPASRLDDNGRGIPAENLPKADRDVISLYKGGEEGVWGTITTDKRGRPIHSEEVNKISREVAAGNRQAMENVYGKEAVQKTLDYADNLDAKLRKVSDLEGTVYRVEYEIEGTIKHPKISSFGDSETKFQQYQDSVFSGGVHGVVSNQYQVGSTVTYNQFLSTARTKTPSYRSYEYSEGYGDYGDAWSISPAIRLKITSKTGKSIEKVGERAGEQEVLFGRGASFMVRSKVWNTGQKSWDIELEQL
jgi:hypothetical protein